MTTSYNLTAAPIPIPSLKRPPKIIFERPPLHKPSRAAVRVLTIISLIEGAVIEAGKHADPLIYNRVQYAQGCCQHAMNTWVVNGGEKETLVESLQKLHKIAEGLNKIWWLRAKPDMNLAGMLYISMQLLDDLMVIITDKTRQLWLKDIFDSLTLLVDYVDPEGVMFLTQDRAQEVVNTIYNVVGER